MSEDTSNAAAPACENCGTVLHGEYCHACGQGVHSPVRSFGHALEEVFESFWHLDGRVFRTLRDLASPGRVACNYLAGQRARYMAPLRLFVILSLLTFFVGKLTVHVEGDTRTDAGVDRIEAARTIPEVERIRDELLGELKVAEKEAAKVPGVNAALVTARVRIEGEAADRIAQLRKRAAKAGADADATPASAKPEAKPAADPARGLVIEDNTQWRFNDRPWDEKTNPVDIGWLPAIGDRWVNHKIGRAKANLASMDGNADRFMQTFLGTVPTALFLLMPVFALLLKVFYLGSGRLYLEHMVVALYSHAWLLLMLLAGFVLGGITGATSAAWVSILATLVAIGMWIWVPVYLFLMQRRVYGEGWLLTTLKFLMIGSVYFFLVTFATVMAFLAGLVS
jgi:hypothetical protein